MSGGGNSPLDPRDLAGLLERARAWAPAGMRPADPGMREIVIAEDARPAVAERVAAAAGDGVRVGLVQDGVLIERDGEPLKAEALERLRQAGMGVVVYELANEAHPEQPFHATMDAAEALARRLEADGVGVVVSVGAGSVTDVAKHARVLAERRGGAAIPQVCIPTAASVTAYSSALAVLTVHGVKRTHGSRAPEVILCDLRTLADAPAVLTRAGFGDVLARSVSYADWWLASQMGLDDGYNEVPSLMLGATEAELLARAEGLAGRDPDAVRLLLEALLLSGIAMSVVNQTAPLSGWEHTISHMLDLISGATGAPGALHGAQVGVGTLVAARAYDGVEALPIERILKLPNRAALQAACDAAVGPFGVEAGVRGELVREVEEKYAAWEARRVERERFVAEWRNGAGLHALRGLAKRAEEIEGALARAGAARGFGELAPPVSAERAAHVVRWAHLVRKRFTLGDLLYVCGALDEDGVGRLIGSEA